VAGIEILEGFSIAMLFDLKRKKVPICYQTPVIVHTVVSKQKQMKFCQ